jgi:hypothetical protein
LFSRNYPCKDDFDPDDEFFTEKRPGTVNFKEVISWP